MDEDTRNASIPVCYSCQQFDEQHARQHKINTEQAKEIEQLRERIKVLDDIRIAAEGLVGSMCRIKDSSHFPPCATSTMLEIRPGDAIVQAINEYWEVFG